MDSYHLSDEVLQACLLNEIEQDDVVDTHLRLCSGCRQRLEGYRLLINQMQELKTETYSFDSTVLVMDVVVQYAQQKKKRQVLYYWGGLLFLVIAIGSFSIPFIPAIIEVFRLPSLNTSILLTGTAVAVVVFLVTDMMQQYKSKEEQLLENNLQPKR
jgi:hypothetical protein